MARNSRTIQVLDDDWHETSPVDLQPRHLARSQSCSFEARLEMGDSPHHGGANVVPMATVRAQDVSVVHDKLQASSINVEK
eukprot:Skav236797  [mRNA]  locus=scaffold1361:563478:563928:- [translate_table: standard]